MSQRRARVDVAAEFAAIADQCHPSARLMPLPTEEEFLAIEASILARGQQAHGLRLDGLILDGRTRLVVARRNKSKFLVRDIELADGETATDVVLDFNLHRRHLTPAQRRALARRMLKESPERSDRAIAEKTGVSDKTVGKARKEMESGAEIPHLAQRQGKDRKTYSTPRETRAEPRDSLGRVIPEALRDLFGERWYADALKDLDALLRRAEIVAAAVEDRSQGSGFWGQGNPYLERTKLLSELSMAVHSIRSAKRRVQDAKPDSVCAQCEGAGCRECRRAGWRPFAIEAK